MYLGLGHRGSFFPHAAGGGAATHLVATTAPGLSGASPYTLSPQPVLAAKDGSGITDASYVTSVVATLNVLTGSPVLSGTTTKACVAGVATFTNLVVTGAGTWTLTFTSGSLTSATSGTGTTTSFTPFSAGFNFRATSGFVTDGAGESPVLGEQYPHTYANGAVAGWGSAGTVQTRDREAGIDRRLAGTNFDDTTANTFRVDLPAAGTYSIRLAMGDPDNGETVGCTMKDGATTVLTASATAIASGHAIDAAGTDLTDAAWPGSNAAVSVTMAGTALIVSFPSPANGDMQHVSIVRTA